MQIFHMAPILQKLGGNMNDCVVDVIVRFHDISRLSELKRCIFSLIGQEYRPLNIILVLQRFTEEQIEATKLAIAPLFALVRSPTFQVVNWNEKQPLDARSKLLNVGLQVAQGRFVAFLDYDDLLFPEAYKLLTTRMIESGAAIGFASVQSISAHPYKNFMYNIHVDGRPPGNGLKDLFWGNFCPLHSYLIDRKKVTPDYLYFDETRDWEEDYDMLLRICAQFKSDFSLIGTDIGYYYHKDDGSNTVACIGGIAEDKMKNYTLVCQKNWHRKNSTPVSIEVQVANGIVQPVVGMTIQKFCTILARNSVNL
jgi:hypothetical protein